MPQRRIKKVTLTAFDRAMFEGLRMAMDVIAGALGQSCEVVFHSFEDPGHSLVKIVNGHVSGRELGSPVTDVFLQILHDKDTELQDLLQYYTNTEDGRPIRCVARLVKNSSGELIGLMGINQDLSVPFIDFVSNFMPRNGSASVVIPEHFSTSARDLLHQLIETAMEDADAREATSSTSKTRLVVADLHRRGAFEIKGAVEVAAREMGVSIYTVYNYIREAKASEKNSRSGG